MLFDICHLWCHFDVLRILCPFGSMDFREVQQIESSPALEHWWWGCSGAQYMLVPTMFLRILCSCGPIDVEEVQQI